MSSSYNDLVEELSNKDSFKQRIQKLINYCNSECKCGVLYNFK